MRLMLPLCNLWARPSCRVPELKEVLDLVDAQLKAHKPLGVAVHVKEPQYHHARRPPHLLC